MNKCWNCGGSFLKEDNEGDIICNHCGRFSFQIIDHPINYDIERDRKETQKRKYIRAVAEIKYINVTCSICNNIFETIDRGKITKLVCSDECDEIRKKNYQKKRNKNRKRKKQIQRTF